MQTEVREPRVRVSVLLSAPRYFTELNALRGLAAVIVILYHFRLLLPIHNLSSGSWMLWNGILRPFVSGPQAVIFFFILSGFVLSVPVITGRSQTYGAYLLRRTCRIYLPYLAALAIGVSCAALFWIHPLDLRWVENTWSEPVRPWLVLSHVLFLGDYQMDQFVTVCWSLVVEMRLSIVFPFFCLLLLKLRPRTAVPGLVALSAAGMSLDHHWPMQSEPCLTLHYAAMFGLGILAARYIGALSVAYCRLHSFGHTVPVWGGLLLFSFGTSGTLGSARLGAGFMHVGDWIVAAGCLLLIVASMNHSGLSKLLSARLPQWLGTISYSLYLVHSLVLFTLLHLLYGRVLLIILLPVYLGTTIGVTCLFYLAVEKPATELSRSIRGWRRHG